MVIKLQKTILFLICNAPIENNLFDLLEKYRHFDGIRVNLNDKGNKIWKILNILHDMQVLGSVLGHSIDEI